MSYGKKVKGSYNVKPFKKIFAWRKRDLANRSSPPRKPVQRDEVRLWLEDSDDSWKVARQNFELGNYHVAAFYTHAAVEKALKAAVIAFKRRAPMKTHNLKELYSEVAGHIELSEEQRDFLGELTPVFQISRYVDLAAALPRDVYSRKLAERYLSTAQPILKTLKDKIEL